MSPSSSRLNAILADPQAAARACGRPVVGLIGSAIPVEMVRAAGCFPLALRARAMDHDRDSTPMEAGHEAEARSLFVQAIDGEFALCDLIVVASTSDAYRYLFQYLKQMVRSGRAPHLPPVMLYDFLFGDSLAVGRYDGEIIRQFAMRLGMVGAPIVYRSIIEAIDETNHLRAMLDRLAVLRWQGRVRGGEAFRAIGATGLLDGAASEALLRSRIAGAGEPSPAPRLLVASSVPLYHTALHDVLEEAGGHVAAEDDEWGARRGGPAIVVKDNPYTALQDHYRLHAASPRQPTGRREAWFAAALARGVDGVIFYMPPEDQHFGWRYPALAQMCADSGIPALLLRDDVTVGLGRAAAVEIAGEFVAGLGGRS